MIYSEKVMEHFQNPRNVGVIQDADGVGQVGNPVCGDMMSFYIKVVSEMAMGKTIEEVLKITNKSVAEELGGLPKNKLHCSNLGADALHKAIENYKERQRAGAEKKEAQEKSVDKEKCYCPYCEGPLEGLEDYCTKCGIELEECPGCGEPVKKGDEKCPHCGATKVRV